MTGNLPTADTSRFRFKKSMYVILPESSIVLVESHTRKREKTSFWKKLKQSMSYHFNNSFHGEINSQIFIKRWDPLVLQLILLKKTQYK